MFTGIIVNSGIVDAFESLAAGARVRLHTVEPETFTRGESLAVNGVCLTMLPEHDGTLVADLSNETLERTNLGALHPGARVNLERALALGDRLGGHLVQGHVDCVGHVESIRDEGEFAVYRWSFPVEFRELVVSKGSIAVDGVSLTIVDPDDTSFAVALIPETLRRTNIGASKPGTRVNLEFDMVAKYVRSLALPYLTKTTA